MPLVLSRRIGEKVYVDGPCTIVNLGICKGKTKLAFICDPTTKVMRSELLPHDKQGGDHGVAAGGSAE